MNALTNYLLALVDLAEAEGRRARRGVARLAASLALLAAGTALLVAGLGLVMWALYSALRVHWGRAPSALTIGLVAILLAALLAWLARRALR